MQILNSNHPLRLFENHFVIESFVSDPINRKRVVFDSDGRTRSATIMIQHVDMGKRASECQCAIDGFQQDRGSSCGCHGASFINVARGTFTFFPILTYNYLPPFFTQILKL